MHHDAIKSKHLRLAALEDPGTPVAGNSRDPMMIFLGNESHHLTPAEIAEGKLLLTARPCASVSGRLIGNGEPLTGAIVTPAVAPTGDFTQSLASVRTDENGYFKAVLLPGCKYILRMEGKPFNYARFNTEIEISPG